MAEEQREAMQFLAQQPTRFAALTLRRILFTWTAIWDFPPRWTWLESGLPNVLTYTFFSILAFAGIGRSLREGREGMIPLIIPLLCISFAYYITHSLIRFRHSADPMVVIFAAYGALGFLDRKSGTAIYSPVNEVTSSEISSIA
jgi:hypothetical protein